MPKKRRFRGVKYDKGREPLPPAAARVISEAFRLGNLSEEERDQEAGKLAKPQQLPLFGKGNS